MIRVSVPGTEKIERKSNTVMKNYLKQLYDIAVMYYEDKLTQEEIAEKTGISRPQVSRALAQAVTTGIVEIKVNLLSPSIYIAESLRKKLGLEKVYVAPYKDDEDEGEHDTADDVAAFASDVLARELHSEENIGVGWGDAVYRTIKMLSPLDDKARCSLCFPLVSSVGFHEPCYQMNLLVGMMAEKIHARPLFFNEASIANESTDEMRRAWDNINVAIVGIGPYPATKFRNNPMASEWLDKLDSRSPKGDILGRFYNEDGYLEASSRLVNIPVKSLSKADKIIAISSGRGKTEAIRIAAKLGYITHLIIDQDAAEELLDAVDGGFQS